MRERGVGTLIDRAEIYAFEDWWRRIEGLITQADTTLFVLSRDQGAFRQDVDPIRLPPAAGRGGG